MNYQIRQSRIEKVLTVVFMGLILLAASGCQTKLPKKKPNVLLICIDDLRPELKSFGVDYISSPNIDGLASKGLAFTRHYVNSPSCGPSRYTLLTGKYGPSNNYALFERALKLPSDGTEKSDPSMPEWFREQGYKTVSVGKVSHHPGGRGGSDWNDSTILEIPNAWDRHLMPVGQWLHPKGAMHGLASGEIRKNPNEMDVFQSVEGEDNIYPDGLITDESLHQLRELSKEKEKPFFLAVGLIKPHLPFGAPKRYMSHYKNIQLPAIEHSQKPKGKTTWHRSGEFMKYHRWGKDPNQDDAFATEIRKHYAACVSYADAQVGKILAELKRTGADKNTIVVLWGDHGWHLGEHAIWGKHSLFEESLRSPLIIHSPKMKGMDSKTNAIVETLDIFPTLCDLTGIPTPNFAQGKSLMQIMDTKNPDDLTAVAYTPNAKTIRTATHRFILHDDGHMELYDHTKTQKETANIASDQKALAEQLRHLLQSKLQSP